MIAHCIKNLRDTQELLSNLKDCDYGGDSTLLSGSSIGQHTRHILEFYQCLFHALDNEVVNYDKRNRKHELEVSTANAIHAIDNLTVQLQRINGDKNLQIEANFSTLDDETVLMQTTLFRELAYNLEHAIHHQAIIKIALKQAKLENIIPSDFGLAPATIRYNASLAENQQSA